MITGRIRLHPTRVDLKKFLSQVVKGILCFCTFNNALKSNDFFRTFFAALFFKSIIDLGISMSGRLFLRGVFWELVCLRVATILAVNYKEDGRNI